MWFLRAGSAAQYYTPGGAVTDPSFAARVVVGEGNRTSSIDITMPPNGTVTGTVVDTTGTAIQGVTVTLTSLSDSSITLHVSSDEHGVVRFDDVAPGMWNVSGGASPALVPPPGGPIQVRSGITVAFQLVYLHAAHVTGVVRDDRGAARPNATITAFASNHPAVAATSAADGSYELFLAPDTWTLVASNIAGFTAPVHRELTVAPADEIRNVDFVYTAIPVLTAVSGQVSLTTTAGHQSTPGSFTLRNTGQATATGIVVSPVGFLDWVQISPSNPADLAPGETTTIAFVASAPADLPRGTYSGQFQVAATNATQLLTGSVLVVLQPTETGMLTITATDDAGQPLTNARVSVSSKSPSAIFSNGTFSYTFDQLTASTNGDGVARFTVPVGTWLYDVNQNHRVPAQGSVDVPAGGSSALASLSTSPEDLTFTFSVVPTVVQDHYEVTLTSTYAVQVPVPTLHVNPNLLLLDFACGTSVRGAVTVSNPSLVRIDNIRLHFGGAFFMAPFDQDEQPLTLDAGQSGVLHFTAFGTSPLGRVPSPIGIQVSGNYISFPSGETPVVQTINVGLGALVIDSCGQLEAPHYTFTPGGGGGGGGGSVSITGLGGWGGVPSWFFTLFNQPFKAPTIREIIKVQMKQDVSIEREAFAATLTAANNTTHDATNFSASVTVWDSSHHDVTSQFAITPPELSVLTNVSGQGRLSAGGTGSSTWTLIPHADVGGTDPAGRNFTVTSHVSYTLGGVGLTFDSDAEPIVVHPAPHFVLDYYMNRYVRDGTFTIQLNLRNTGPGSAPRVSIVQAQPTIVENVSRVAVAFTITGSQVDDAFPTSALNATMANVAPDSTHVLRWFGRTNLESELLRVEHSIEHKTYKGVALDPLISPSDVHVHIVDVELTPASSSIAVGGSQTITAHLSDNSGLPPIGLSILFQVAGANPTSGTHLLNLDGLASFSYSGLLAGSDQISASVLIGNHTLGSTQQSTVAQVVWTSNVPSPVVPLIFMPGIAGSALWEQPSKELWPGCLSSHYPVLSLLPEDNPSPTIFAPDALRKAGCFGHFEQDIYQSTINYLVQQLQYKEYRVNNDPARRTPAHCDTSQDSATARPTLFVFAYDWRFNNAYNAALLKDYVDCVHQFHPGSQIDILAHSMGGMIARRYIVNHQTDHSIRNLITMGTPWLGSPKAIAAFTSGTFFDDWKQSLAIADAGTIQKLIASFTGAQQLLPSSTYFELGDMPPLVEKDRDISSPPNQRTDDTFDFSTFVHIMDATYGKSGFTPGTATSNFHQAAQDDFRETPYGVSYYTIYGERSTADTIGQVVAIQRPVCSRGACATVPDWTFNFVRGDHTVPVASASKHGNGKDRNAPGVQLEAFYGHDKDSDDSVEHGGLARNPDVLDRVRQILSGGRLLAGSETATHNQAQVSGVRARPLDLGPARAQQTFADARYITLVGVESVSVTDPSGRTTNEVAPGVFQDIPGVTIYPTSAHNWILTLSTDSDYLVSFRAVAAVFVEVVVGDGSVRRQVYRYHDVDLSQGSSASLQLSAATPVLSIDADGDGAPETVVTPSTAVSGANAADLDPPNLAMTVATSIGTQAIVTVTATDSASGVQSIHYSTDGVHFATYSGSFSVDASTTRTVYAFADDIAGNRSQIQKLNIDGTQPGDRQPPETTASVAPPAAGAWSRTPVGVHFDAVDDAGGSGVSEIHVSLDGAESRQETIVGATGTIPVAANGLTTLTYFAVDRAGNNESPKALNIRIDSSPPQTRASIPAVPASGWYTGAIGVSLTATDELSGIDKTYYQIDAEPASLYLNTFTYNRRGRHTLRFWSTDVAGNSEPFFEQSLALDDVAPSLTAQTAPQADEAGFNNSPVTIRFTCEDADSGVVDCPPATQLNSEGLDQTLSVAAVDLAGNTRSAIVGPISIDFTSPTTSVSLDPSPTTTGWNNSEVTITLSALDNVAGIQETRFRMDAGIWRQYTTPVKVSSDGEHVLEFFSIDRAENVEIAQSIAIRIDRQAPTISGQPIVTTAPASARVVWSTDEATGGQVEYGLTTAYGLTSPVDSSLARDHAITLAPIASATTYHYRIISTDIAGNRSVSGDFTFSTVDAALALDGTQGYAEADPAADLNLTSSWTVETWFKDDDPHGFDHDYRVLVSKGDRDANPEAPYFITVGYKQLFVGVRTRWTDYAFSISLRQQDARPEDWHHVAATFDGPSNTLTVYIDGRLAKSGKLTRHSTSGNTLPLQIGRGGPVSGKYWMGKIDDLRIWNTVRSANAILASYRSRLSGSQPGLVANWLFDQISNAVVPDETGKGHNATLRGTAGLAADHHP